MPSRKRQADHYDKMMADRTPTRGLSCGFDSRFDPFLLDDRPELFDEFDKIFGDAFPNPPERLLDIGCGSGLYFPTLSRRAGRVVGIDISKEMVKAARTLIDVKKLGNIEVLEGSAEELPFPDESFDAVLGFDVLHHIQDVERALQEVKRVLRPGGKFVSIEPNVLNPVVWLAHALPREERGALRYNYPWVIGGLVRKEIGKPESKYVNHVTGANSNFILAGIRVLNFMTRLKPFRYFCIRMIWSAEKP
jgi:SAM-dependent methyltransferase